MNTSSELSALNPAPRLASTPARRRLAAAVLGLSLPLVAACSADGGASGPTGNSALPATMAPATAGTEDNATSPTVVANGDPFCDLAIGAQADALAAQEFTASFEPVISGIASGTAPIADLNAWGTELGEHTQQALDFYHAAGPYVAGTEGEGPFTALESFTRDYSLTLATMAATATDANTFLTEFATFVQTPEMGDTILLGPAASTSVAAYITERCPTVS